MKYIIFFIISCLIITNNSQAQSDSTSRNKPQLKLSINYNSNLNYYGRTDSLRSSAVFPILEFWATPRLYINTTPIFVNNKVQSFDYAGTVLTAGYQYMSDKWLNNIYVTKTFYEKNAQVVQSALEAQTGISLTYLNKFLNITAGGDVKFSDSVDIGATVGLDHLFRVESGNSVWILDPSAYAYIGTQHFTATYNKKRNGFLLFPGTTEPVTEQKQKFSLLAYEFSAPIIYSRGKMQLIASPSYIIPQNLLTAPESSGSTTKEKNLFYTTLTAKYTF